MIPESIKQKMGRNLHMVPNHPIEIIKRAIYEVLHDFEKFDTFDPVVSVEDNFDHLLIPQDHPSRSPKDTYYVDDKHVLRTHTSAHQHQLIRDGHWRFCVTGDVYRRDAIDRSHYPIFHQMEGVALFQNVGLPYQNQEHTRQMMEDYLRGIVDKVFSKYGKPQLQNPPPARLVPSTFPFTEPSWELEIEWRNGEWLEVAGCGLVHPEVIARAGNGKSALPQYGWAFGIGLERLAMLVFHIPDIRLFWSQDERFLSQFQDLDSKFRPFSVQPNCYKDISFWAPEGFSENDFNQLVRDHGNDLVESVQLVDTFVKGDRVSHCFRLNYRAMDRTLTNPEVNAMLAELKEKVVTELHGEIR